MMIHTNVPNYLWSDVVLSACHLINRMSSSVLQGKVPFSCLYPVEVFFILFLESLDVHVLFRTYLLI